MEFVQIFDDRYRSEQVKLDRTGWSKVNNECLSVPVSSLDNDILHNQLLTKVHNTFIME